MSSFYNATSNNSTFNGSSEHPTLNFHCYHHYQYFRVFYIPLVHGMVMIAGLVVNMCMIIKLRRTMSKDSGRQNRTRRDTDYFFLHLGFCDIATLMTIPIRVTQAIFVKGWVFGFVVCKLVKGLITFCFQYGVFLLVYINLEMYMKIVHNRTLFGTLLVNRRGSRRRRIVSRLCGCLPAFWALLDICYYTVRPISENSMICFSGMHPYYQIVTFWLKMSMCFILPLLILLYCNGMIVYRVRRHVNLNSFGHKMKKAQLLPILTAAMFFFCWTPLIGSTVYYSSHKTCEEVKYVVFNLCVAIGNMHCITSPALYIFTRFRRRVCHPFSFRCSPGDNSSSQQTCPASQNKNRSVKSTSGEQEQREGSASQNVKCSVNSTSQEQERREESASLNVKSSVNTTSQAP